MMSILGTLFAFAIVFGILVFVHEFGHFFMAKLVKVRVEVFSWGYGKRIFGIKRGETDYRVSLIPMGGYVKFSGEESFDEPEKLDSRDLMAKKRWERFLVLAMGSLMNIVLAIVLMAFINIVGVNVHEYQDQTPVIGYIEPGSPAEKSNLRIDDEILSINGKRTETWANVELAVGTKPKRKILVEVRRDGDVLNVGLITEAKTRFEMGYAGFFGKILTQVVMIEPRSPAEKAGIKPGDIITAIDGEPVYYYKFVEIIQNNPGNELDIQVDREGQEITLKAVPRLEGKVGKIGIAQVPKSITKKYGLFSAIAQSVKQNIELTFLIANFIKDLVTGEASTRQLGGPIEIANFSYAALRMGFMAMISWIALISLQLGIINLVPIPVLDGGQILVLALEGLFRRDFSPRVKQFVIKVGFAIFIVLITFVILNDIQKRLPDGWQSFIPF